MAVINPFSAIQNEATLFSLLIFTINSSVSYFTSYVWKLGLTKVQVVALIN